MGSNRIVLILIFIGVGYFLLYRDSEGPLSKFSTSLGNVFSTEKNERIDNPYKAKDKISQKSEELISKAEEVVTKKVEEKSANILSEFKERIFGKATPLKNDLPEDFFPVSAQNLEVVNHKAYTLGYNEDHEQAAWTFHILTRESTVGQASRSGIDFMPDSKVSTSSALSSDFTRTGYDRGHLVPAGDFKCCQDLLRDTFWVSNLTPQNPDCNRNIWNNLEQQTRNWARKKGEVFVFTGPVLKNGLKKIGKYNRISIPENLYKIILYIDHDDVEKSQVKAFMMPNESNLGFNFNRFKVSVDEVEKATGLDFLAPLADNLENRLEETISTDRW